MTFNSFSYFLFLPVVYLIFYFTADRWRWLVLLIASYGFYASFKAPYLLAVLLMVTGISYACGLRIAAQQDETIRKRWLWIGSFACVAILALMKYLPFLESKTNNVFGFNSTISSTLISIGVSYFTFQAISYIADIYLEIEEEPEHHFGRFALYMAFFPKLLQGPIERASDLLPQLKKQYQFDYDSMRSGMLLFTWGLFKKVVVADRIAIYVSTVFKNPEYHSGITLLIATYAYSFQIYSDFSGYTDMARGTGRMFGINLTENFNRPYLATSIADFWRRWHISFSRWILDYIFKPLQIGWRNWGQAGTAAALIITFLVSGIWHGATWGFVIWGLIHGTYLTSSTYYRPYQKKLHKWFGADKSLWLKWWQVFVTFNLVAFAWIFFKSDSLHSALSIILKIASLSRPLFIDDSYQIIQCAPFLSLMLIYESSKINTVTQKQWFFSEGHWLREQFVCGVLIITIILFGVFDSSQFIYFQF
ncbi:membrane bound O-acyl transferase MBOAT family protein [Geoanaerobacter pelophilus]|uniref:Membrane bound O-acyl transferase MBOAT family protein n=1 Tax=Geoanaerobacter pelophilus TaxID=60036 RepID=A0ABQ0MFG9_9BACT|nr:MBOAT family O-acyltransferase [Geoanaerobacter pelophilus]GAW65845.1 membrane bound O-acyl transferase MBOAT family protein [Geoanaerobacter pelophilus]